MGGRREVSIIFYRPMTRSDLKRERSFFRGSVSSFLQLVESSRPKGTNSPPSPPLVQCRFGLTAQVCISCVIINNIAKVEGGNGLLICDGKHFCQGEWKKCNVSQQVLSKVVYRCFSAFFNCDINYHESLSFVKEKCMKLIVFEHFSFLWND